MEEEKKEIPAPQPEGEKTPENQVQEELSSLKKQVESLSAQKDHWREKAGKFEEELTSLKETSSPSEDDVFSDEGKTLKKEISSLKEELGSLKTNLTIAELKEKHPALKDKWEEFEEFRTNPDNRGMNLRTQAKAFLIEKELLQPANPPERKGLEKPTGGTKTPVPQEGYTFEEARRIRENDPKLYEKLVREQRLKIISK